MRIPATLVLLLAFGVPARAQQQSPPQAEKVQSELLELEQEVDRTLLREAVSKHLGVLKSAGLVRDRPE